MRVCVVKEHQF